MTEPKGETRWCNPVDRGDLVTRRPLGLATQLWVCVGLAFCVGCGEGIAVAPVTGRITLDGQPLVGATITTQPIATDSMNPGPGSFGVTDETGRYELELVKPIKQGAIVGEHRVMISRPEGTDQPSSPGGAEPESWSDDPNAHLKGVSRGWPSRYSDGSLRLVVSPEGNAEADFELTEK